MRTKVRISSIVGLIVFSILVGGCSEFYLKLKTEEAQNSIKIYIQSIYENDYKKFKKCTYAESETLKQLSFESFQIAIDLNNDLETIYGIGAVSDHNLYSQDNYGISDLPRSINYGKLSNLEFRKWKGKYGMYEPQTATFFEFKIKNNQLLVNLQADILNISKYLIFLEKSIEYMVKVKDQIKNGEAVGKSIKEFAESAYKI